MRRLLAVLISLLLVLNAANALAQGVCDAFEHLSMHHCGGAHLGHHQHHDAVTEHVGEVDDGHGAQSHGHAHPSFSTLASGDFVLPAACTHATVVPATMTAPASADPGRLERPPRARPA